MLLKIKFYSEVYVGISPSFINTVSAQWILFYEIIMQNKMYRIMSI